MRTIFLTLLMLTAFAAPVRADDRSALGAQDAALKTLVIHDPSGHRLDLAAHPGQILLVDFWANWCPNCLAELTSLQKLQQDLGSSHIQIVLVSQSKDWAKDQAYAAAHHIAFPLYVSEIAPASTLAAALKGRVVGGTQVAIAFPTAAVYRPDGTLLDSRVGAQNWSTAAEEKTLRTALAVQR